MDNFAHRLHEERQRLGLTLEELAELGGAAPEVQVSYENGARLPEADYLAKIAEAGVNVCYVLLGAKPGNSNATVHPDYRISTEVAAHLPVDVLENTLEVLRSKIWETAAAISEITALADPSQRRTAKYFINEHLQDFPYSGPKRNSIWRFRPKIHIKLTRFDPGPVTGDD